MPVDAIERRIFVIRGHKVMFDHDRAALYGGPTKALIQAVKRNIERFPSDFMFELSWDEVNSSRSQIVTLKSAGKEERMHWVSIPRGPHFQPVLKCIVYLTTRTSFTYERPPASSRMK